MYDFDNAADEKAVDSQRQEINNQQDLLIEDYRAILKTNEGRRFFKHFFKKGKLISTSMSGNSWTFFNEGHRNFANMIYNELCRANAEEAARIMTELNLEQIKEQKNA